jgi:hypothetical protein
MSRFDPTLPGEPYEPGRDPFPNPYAAPEADLTAPAGPYVLPGRAAVEPFSIDSVLRRAWRAYKGNLGVTIAVVFTLQVLNFGFGQGIESITGRLRDQGAGPAGVAAVTGLLYLVDIVVVLWLTAGQSLALLKVMRGQGATFGDLFRGGRFFARIIGASILFVLALAPVLVVAAVPAVVAVAAGGGRADVWVSLLGIVASVVLAVVLFVAISMRLSQYLYVLIDRDCGIVDSLRGSAEITRGHVVELIGVSMTAGLIGMSGLLALCVGVVFTYPLAMLIMAAAYDSLAAEHLAWSRGGPAGAKPAGGDLTMLDA